MEKMKKYPSFADILAIVGVFILTSVVIGGIVGGVLSLAGVSQEVMMAIVYPLPMVCTALFAIFYGRGRGEKKKPALCFALPPRHWGLVLGGLVLMLSMSVVLEPLLSLFPKEWFEWMNAQIGRGVWTIITTVVMASVLEEWLFRGIVQRSAENAYGPVAGILISATVFGVIHLMPMQVINAFALGIALGYVYYKTRSLTAVILMHAANNGLAYYMAGVGPADATLRDALPSAGVYTALYAVCVLVVVVGVPVIFHDLGKKRAPEQ